MTTFEKLVDYKRAAKNFLRGVVKAGVFAQENGKLDIYWSKADEDEKTVGLDVCNGTFCARFNAAVATRIFNKFDEELVNELTKIIASSKKITGLNIISK